MPRKTAVAASLFLLCAGYPVAEERAKTSGLGPLPPQALLLLPAEADMMLGLDVKGLFASTLVTRLRAGDLSGMGIPPEQAEELKKNGQEGFDKFLREAEQESSIRPDRDVDTVVVSISNARAKDPDIVGLVLGRFDRAAIAAALQAKSPKGQKLETRSVAGATLYLAGGADKGGLAVLDERTLVFGTTAALEAMVTRHARRAHALDSNRPLMDRIATLKPGAGFWLLTQKSMIDKMTEGQTTPPPMPVPTAFTMTIDWDAGLEMVAQMADQEAAKNLGDVIQGGIGMMRMRASQDPEMQKSMPGLQELISGISVKAEGTSVRLVLPGQGGTAGMGIMAAIAIPSLLRARISANEAAAIGDIRTVISSQEAFSGGQEGGYATPACLAAPATCIKAYTGPSFLSDELGSLKDKFGYKRGFHPGKPGSRFQTLVGYAYTATPVEPGKSGVRSFCGDASGVICFDPKGAEFVIVDGKCPAGCSVLQ